MEHPKAFFVYKTAVKVADVLTVLGIWYLSWAVRFYSSLLPVTKGIPDFADYREATIVVPMLLVFATMFHMTGAYRNDRIPFGFRALKKIVQGSILGTLVFISVLYFLGEANYSRYFLVVFTVLTIVAVVIERACLDLLWRRIRDSQVKKVRVLLIGSGNLLSLYVSKINSEKPFPVAWVGWLGNQGDTNLPASIPRLGGESNLLSVVRREPVDRVVVSYPPKCEARYAAILATLSNELINTIILPDFGKESTFTYRAEHECGIPVLLFNQAPASITDRTFKRIFDACGSAVLLLFLAPLFAVITILVKLTSKGPIFFVQKRMGADGKIFNCYKFRSMVVGAEESTGPVWAVPDDERTTAFGKWLRRTSLDELPQFYNVLKGDMSLVGPRPERPVFVDQFRNQVPKYMFRHKMKSGITGWAQINGWRGNTSIEERVRHDLYYIAHWSHLFDIKILVLTLFRGFVHKNAY